MTRCCTVIVFCALLVGCDGRERRGGIAGPEGPAGPPPPQKVYTLSGRVTDVDGVAVPGATIEIGGPNPSATVVSDELGRYRFDNVGGFVVIRVTKADYIDLATTTWVTADQALTLTLYRWISLTVDSPVRGTIQGPTCDPRWDAQALCQHIYFTPPETGLYELNLQFNNSAEIDVLVDGGIYLTADRPGQIRATIFGRAGVRSEIFIYSYYSPQPYELTVSRTAP
jgi:carboxypeptidase family protein